MLAELGSDLINPHETEYDPPRCEKCGKICYSRRKAGEILNYRKKSKKIPKRTYVCPECGTWHLTSIRKYITKKMVRENKNLIYSYKE